MALELLAHDVMVGILAVVDIHDNRSSGLCVHASGRILEDWIWGATLSGAPQGGVYPHFVQIHLDRLDYFVEILIPQYTRGERRAANPAYSREWHRRSDEPASRATAESAGLPSGSACCRAWIRKIPDTGGCVTFDMAANHLLGTHGPKAEAEKIKARLARSCEKTSA